MPSANVLQIIARRRRLPTLPTARILNPCARSLWLKPRVFHDALVPSALKKSRNSSSARSSVTGGISELVRVAALPGSTLWIDGGCWSSACNPRPERTMYGRLCCMYAGGYASIAMVDCCCPCRIVWVELDAGRDSTPGIGFAGPREVCVHNLLASVNTSMHSACAYVVRLGLQLALHMRRCLMLGTRCHRRPPFIADAR